MKQRADVFPDGSVALVRDAEGVMEIKVAVDDVMTPERVVPMDTAEYERLSEVPHEDIRFDKSKKRFAISKHDPDTKGQKDTK